MLNVRGIEDFLWRKIVVSVLTNSVISAGQISGWFLQVHSICTVGLCSVDRVEYDMIFLCKLVANKQDRGLIKSRC